MKYKAIKGTGGAIKIGHYYEVKRVSPMYIEMNLDGINFRFDHYSEPFSTFEHYFGKFREKIILNKKVTVL